MDITGFGKWAKDINWLLIEEAPYTEGVEDQYIIKREKMGFNRFITPMGKFIRVDFDAEGKVIQVKEE